MAADPDLLKRRQRLNALQRHRPNDPDVIELRRDVAADAIARYVRRTLDGVPLALTLAQRSEIVGLLAPADAAA